MILLPTYLSGLKAVISRTITQSKDFESSYFGIFRYLLFAPQEKFTANYNWKYAFIESQKGKKETPNPLQLYRISLSSHHLDKEIQDETNIVSYWYMHSYFLNLPCYI